MVLSNPTLRRWFNCDRIRFCFWGVAESRACGVVLWGTASELTSSSSMRPIRERSIVRTFLAMSHV